MICEEISKRVMGSALPRLVFEIDNRNLIAGYRNARWCVLYLLNWYDFVDGKISKVSIRDVPVRIRNYCRNLFLIGNIEERSVDKNIYIFHIDTGELDGFLDIGFEAWIKELHQRLSWKSIKEEIEMLYESKMRQYRKVYVETFYPQTGMGHHEKFISNNANASTSLLKR